MWYICTLLNRCKIIVNIKKKRKSTNYHFSYEYLKTLFMLKPIEKSLESIPYYLTFSAFWIKVDAYKQASSLTFPHSKALLTLSSHSKDENDVFMFMLIVIGLQNCNEFQASINIFTFLINRYSFRFQGGGRHFENSKSRWISSIQGSWSVQVVSSQVHFGY